MNSKKFFLIGYLFFITIIFSFAVDRIGELVYIDGEVSITRNGEVLTEYDLYIGDSIENYDFIQTGADGVAELAIKTPRGQETTVIVSNNTAFVIELIKVDEGGDVTGLEMITGTLALKVDRMTGANNVEVRTKSAVMGVRGTEFQVTTTVTDDVLITCAQGKVSCVDEDGKQLYAAPGKVVEKIPGESYRTVDVTPEEIDAYRSRWFASRIEIFKSNALKALRGFALRFAKAYENLVNAYSDLMQKKHIFEKWMREDKQDIIDSKIQVMKEKKEVIGALFKLKRSLFIFERIYFRLLEIEYYFQQGYGRGEIEPGLSATKFFQNLDKKKKHINTLLAQIKYFFKLFAKRNDGYFPVDMVGSFDF